jgi:hypothetical protein
MWKRLVRYKHERFALMLIGGDLLYAYDVD